MEIIGDRLQKSIISTTILIARKFMIIAAIKTENLNGNQMKMVFSKYKLHREMKI
jgi:hypothetical protein